MSYLKNSAAWSLGLALMLLVSSSGCGQQFDASKARPSSDSSLWATIGSGTTAFHRWNDELAVMICTDVQGGSTRTKGRFSGPLLGGL